MTLSCRSIAQIIEPEPVIEGAGVRLKRSIGTPTLDYLDPFLLFDDFTSSHRADYEAGFPLHPHRGIETVTYVLEGEVRHKDTLGNAGSIGAGYGESRQGIAIGERASQNDGLAATESGDAGPTTCW